MHDSLLFLNSHRRFQSSSLIFNIYWPFSAPTSAFIDASSLIFSSAAHSLPPSESLIFCPYHHFRPFFPPPLTIFISSHYLIYHQTRGRFSARIESISLHMASCRLHITSIDLELQYCLYTNKLSLFFPVYQWTGGMGPSPEQFESSGQWREIRLHVYVDLTGLSI